MSGNRAGAAQVHQPLNTPEPFSASTVWGHVGGPFVPVPKKWLLAYQPEERKRRSVSDLVGKLYELDQ